MSSQDYNFGGSDTPSGNDQLSALQQVITDLHQLITILTDPKSTQVATQALQMLMGIQTSLMGSQQGSAQQAIGQRLTGSPFG